MLLGAGEECRGADFTVAYKLRPIHSGLKAFPDRGGSRGSQDPELPNEAPRAPAFPASPSLGPALCAPRPPALSLCILCGARMLSLFSPWV